MKLTLKQKQERLKNLALIKEQEKQVKKAWREANETLAINHHTYFKVIKEHIKTLKDLVIGKEAKA